MSDPKGLQLKVERYKEHKQWRVIQSIIIKIASELTLTNISYLNNKIQRQQKKLYITLQLFT